MYYQSKSFASHSLELLGKIVDRDDAILLLDKISQVLSQVDRLNLEPPKGASRKELIAHALRIVEVRGILNVPNFEQMENAGIQAFIDRYST